MVNSFFNFKVLVLSNDEPDIQVFDVTYDTELKMLQDEMLGRDCVITIVNNLDDHTRQMCPYFRVSMSGFDASCAINFKLQNFYNKIGMSSMGAKCKKAMVVGLHALNQLDSAISVPLCFCTTTIEPMDFDDITRDAGIDMACMNLCHQYSNAMNLCDIAGLSIPCHVPWEVQWKILTYLQSPCASLIEDAIDTICTSWDTALHPMFQQREPRIPASIASFYNVLTVKQAIENATKSFLVPLAVTRNRASRNMASS